MQEDVAYGYGQAYATHEGAHDLHSRHHPGSSCRPAHIPAARPVPAASPPTERAVERAVLFVALVEAAAAPVVGDGPVVALTTRCTIVFRAGAWPAGRLKLTFPAELSP